MLQFRLAHNNKYIWINVKLISCVEQRVTGEVIIHYGGGGDYTAVQGAPEAVVARVAAMQERMK